MTQEYVLKKPTGLTCPECAGALAKIQNEPISQYACHIGHVLTAEAVLASQAERIEIFLTSALAMLNERCELCRQLTQDDITDRSRVESILGDATIKAKTIRDFLNQ